MEQIKVLNLKKIETKKNQNNFHGGSFSNRDNI